MTLVKFTKHFAPYMPGEIAGFPDAEALQLVARGAAVVHTPPDEGHEEEFAIADAGEERSGLPSDIGAPADSVDAPRRRKSK